MMENKKTFKTRFLKFSFSSVEAALNYINFIKRDSRSVYKEHEFRIVSAKY